MAPLARRELTVLHRLRDAKNGWQSFWRIATCPLYRSAVS
jgi:hypothetical protein